MIECVPNFSEGRDLAKVRAIVDAIAAVPSVLLLGWEADPDHHRAVVTFAGASEAVKEGAVRGAGKAVELIDLNHHVGVHPRVGAADVIPFVPLSGSRMEECAALARVTGNIIWARYGMPAYFYEAAARTESRRRLEKIRREGFDGQPPDVGDVAAHPTAGASCIGARGFLIAFNVNLQTDDVEIAREIARKLRESSGGFRHVKAMGVYLTTRGRAQVSMNLTNYAETPLEDVYAAIAAESKVAECELVGFVPRHAFEMHPAFFERAVNFNDSRIIETRIGQLLESK
ncbi:MAG TPA: glutamate formimidoyltransferase [Bryobacteraceae bacterium]|jgi:glutamate formiminotransferase|nr:glutamate formimidoyltransferase [Bryobacteraceae bacterium]